MRNKSIKKDLSLLVECLMVVALTTTLILVNCQKKKDDKTPLFATAALAFTGNSGSSGAIITAPTSLTYTGSPFSYTKNTAITMLTPTLAPTGAVLTTCTASPTLPAGLTLSATTCAISGTPTVATATADYKITASNTLGSTTATINIFVEGTTWIQEAYLKAPNAEANDNFGCDGSSYGCVSISSDTIVVGAFGEDSNQTTITNGTTASANNSATVAGAAYVFKRTGTTWAQEAYLKASNAEALDTFGRSVSISSDTIAVGAQQESSNQTTVTNGTTASADNSASQAGAAYVFKRTGTTWVQEAYLKASNAESLDKFGEFVSISSDTIAVAAQQESSNQTTITNGTTASADNSVASAGAVYVFKRTGSTWAQEAYLKAQNPDTGDRFGNFISVFSDTIAVGTYQEDSNQTTITNGTTASADNSAANAGSVYMFKRTGSTWAQEAYLKASNVEAGDNFGYSVSISSDTIVVGARSEASNQTSITNGTTASADNSAANAGAVYVFKRTGSTWAQEAYLKASNAEANDTFGVAVSVFSDTIAVGANGEDSNQTTITNGTTASANNSALSSGAVYVFKRTGTTWAQEAYLKAPNAGAGDAFGMHISISLDTIAVGASGESSNQTTITNGATASADNSATNAGAVYVFRKQ